MIVNFKLENQAFPDYFPRSSWAEVVHAAARNVPNKADQAVYDFCLKHDDPAATAVAVVLQPGGHVIYNPAQHPGDMLRLRNWVDANSVPLRALASKRHKDILTIVGKIRGGVFYILYVVDKDCCYFDEPSITARLGLFHAPFKEGLTITPVYMTAQLQINKKANSLDMIPPLPDSPVVGFPVIVHERDDSSVPRMYAEVAHMRFLAFTNSDR